MIELLQKLAEQGVSVHVENGQLRLTGPKEKLTPDIIEQLREHKAAILEALSLPTLNPTVIDVTVLHLPWTEDAAKTELALHLTDPRRDLAEDSWLWEQLLLAAYSHDGDKPDGVYGALHGLRCLGAGLVPADTGVGLAPGDIPIGEYRELRHTYLRPHKAIVEFLLAQIKVQPACLLASNHASKNTTGGYTTTPSGYIGHSEPGY